MIKINLCPIDELENRFWWVPDAVILAAVALTAYFGVDYYMNSLEQQIAIVQQETSELQEKHEQLKPDLARFKSLDADISSLQTKIESLKNITVSPIAKYKPIIALEHLHNLSPEGLWYSSIKLAENSSFEVVGEVFDNLLLSEMIANLRSTESQIDDKSDLRTQVQFSGLKLVQTARNDTNSEPFKDITGASTFSLTGAYLERGEALPNMDQLDNMNGANPPLAKMKKSRTNKRKM